MAFTIELTKHCNLNCQHCYNSEHVTEGLSFDEVESILKDAHEYGHSEVLFTGGEPLLQLDNALIKACKSFGFEIAVETNGTKLPPEGIDWICVSPKAGAEMIVTKGDELKLVYPQDGIDPACYNELNFTHLYLQPMDGPALNENSQKSIDYCLKHQKWKLSLQTHKFLGIP